MKDNNKGPIPVGSYAIYTELKGINGSPAFILDPNDNQKLDDSWDNGPYAGRFAFRIHVGTSTQTQGCIVGSASDLSQIAADLTYSPSEGKTYINQKASPYRKDINDPEIFHEFFIGTLTVSE